MKPTTTESRPRQIRLDETSQREIEAERRAHLGKRRRNRAVVARGYQFAAVLPSRSVSAPTFN